MSASEQELRRRLAEGLANWTAEYSDRAEAWERERQLPEYAAALENYAKALWTWVDGETSPRLATELESAELTDGTESAELVKLHYLLDRCVFIEGLRHGRADPEWMEHWLGKCGLAASATVLSDRDLWIEVARRRKARKMDTQVPLKFGLLNCWLGRGLWCAPNRESQWTELEKGRWVPMRPSPRTGLLRRTLSDTALNEAQRSLGLKWLRGGDTKSEANV